MLRELNPQYRRDLVNGLSEPSTIRMPIAAINKYVEQEDTIRLYDSTHNSKRLYAEIDERPRSTASHRSSGSSSKSSGSRYGRSRHQSTQTASAGNTSRYGKSSRHGSRKRGRRG